MWKKAVGAISPQAFAAVGEVFGIRDPAFDTTVVSLALLVNKAFMEMTQEPTPQALSIYIIT